MRVRDFTPVTLQMSKDALSQPDSVWNAYRVSTLDDRELKTYHVVDSIGGKRKLRSFCYDGPNHVDQYDTLGSG